MYEIIGPLKEDVYATEYEDSVMDDVYNKREVDILIEEYEFVIKNLKEEIEKK